MGKEEIKIISLVIGFIAVFIIFSIVKANYVIEVYTKPFRLKIKKEVVK
ncbi:hypothetical protein ACAG39_02015 [Caldicellulosiruptoraceae bacterium PP1]